jgi:hypothetical protein
LDSKTLWFGTHGRKETAFENTRMRSVPTFLSLSLSLSPPSTSLLQLAVSLSFFFAILFLRRDPPHTLERGNAPTEQYRTTPSIETAFDMWKGNAQQSKGTNRHRPNLILFLIPTSDFFFRAVSKDRQSRSFFWLSLEDRSILLDWIKIIN